MHVMPYPIRRLPPVYLARDVQWLHGTHSRSVQGSGLGAEQQHKTAFTDADHPEVFALSRRPRGLPWNSYSGLAGCHSWGRFDRPIRGINCARAKPKGDMDILGVWADTDARSGFNPIQVTFDITQTRTPEEIALVAQSQKRSAVYDIITNSADHRR